MDDTDLSIIRTPIFTLYKTAWKGLEKPAINIAFAQYKAFARIARATTLRARRSAERALRAAQGAEEHVSTAQSEAAFLYVHSFFYPNDVDEEEKARVLAAL